MTHAIWWCNLFCIFLKRFLNKNDDRFLSFNRTPTEIFWAFFSLFLNSSYFKVLEYEDKRLICFWVESISVKTTHIGIWRVNRSSWDVFSSFLANLKSTESSPNHIKLSLKVRNDVYNRFRVLIRENIFYSFGNLKDHFGACFIWNIFFYNIHAKNQWGTVTYEGHARAQDPGIAIMCIHKKRYIF